MTVTLDLWHLLTGAVCSIGGVYAARGKQRLVKAAVVGAVLAFIMSVIRGVI